MFTIGFSIGQFGKFCLNIGVAALAVVPATAQEWTPLKSSEFGSELFQKWVPVPNGDSGAPRQGWLGTADGFFTREAHILGTYTDQRGADGYVAVGRFNYPLSRRFWAGFELPFYQQQGGVTGVGDGLLTTQLFLVETKNVSINTGVGWRLPWGRDALGNGFFSAQPQLNWWTDIGAGFSFRGRIGYTFATQRQPSSFNLNATIGQTITAHSKAPFGDLSWYVAGNWNEPTGNQPTFVSITPGLRTHLGKNLFLLGGVEIPVANTRQFFRERFTIQFVQGF
jgi:hypothetical protein